MTRSNLGGIVSIRVGLDFQEIRQNAQKDGIAIDEIMVVFEGFTAEQVKDENENGANLVDLGNGKFLCRLADIKNDNLQNLATGVLKLSAD